MAGDAVVLKAAIAAQLATVQAESEDGTATINDSVVENADLIKAEVATQAETIIAAISTALNDLSDLAIAEMEQGYVSPAGRGVASNTFRRNIVAAFASKIASLTGTVQAADAAVDAVVDAAVTSVDGLVTTTDGAVSAAVVDAGVACDLAVDVQLP